MQKGKVNTFTYLKEGANATDASNRTILTTYVPVPKDLVVRGIDVTELSEDQRDNLEKLWVEYQEYLIRLRETTFSFEDFIQHTTNQEIKLKWRSFHPEGITE